MAIYRFGNQSPLDEVTVHHTQGGGVRAYLHARANVSPDSLETLKKTLTANSLQYTPIEEDGKPMLEVRGFGKKESSLLNLLAKDGAVSGVPSKLATPDDKISFKDKLAKNKLRISGLAYLFGDVNYLSYGLRESLDSKPKQWFSVAAGVFYALGTPFLWMFGRGDKSDLQLKHMSYNLIKDLKAQKVDVPEDTALHNVAQGHNTTAWKKIKNFCSRYPAEITNSIFAGAGTMIMAEKLLEVKKWGWHPINDYKTKGGVKAIGDFLKHKEAAGSHARWSVIMDVGLGTMTLAAGLISVLIEEEAPRKDEPKKTGLSGLTQKVRERPLAVASGTLIAATLAHAASTYVDWKHAKSINMATATREELAKVARLEGSLFRRANFVGANIVAEIIMGLSSKGHGAGVRSDQSLEHSAYAVAADFIQHNAPEKREDILNKISTFYAHKKHLSGDPEVIRKGIRKELAAIDANPWVGISSAKPAQEEKAKGDNYWRDRAISAPQVAVAAPAL